MLEHETPSARQESPHGPQSHLVLRFRPSERHMHWAVAIPFMVCYTTALVLIFVYNPNPSLPLRRVVSWGHRLSGLCLLLLPLVTLARHRRDVHVHLHNIRKVWTWRPDDVRWLMRIVPASLFGNVSLPHQGKFNAGEKINFVTLTCTYPLLLTTGLVIWFGGVPYLSWLAHFSLAALATPLIIGHIFMATVNPDTRPGLSGVITGLVDRHWASHHYHLWYEEHYGGVTAANDRVPAAADAAPSACPSASSADGPVLPVRHDDREDIATMPGRLFGVIEAGAALAARGAADAPAGQ